MGYPSEADWPDLKRMPYYQKLQQDFQRKSYATSCLQKYMEGHKIRCDTKEFALLQKLLTMDPNKRISAKDALSDPYFFEDPKPTDDVFAKCEIPYPKRDFITQDNEEKNASSKMQTAQQHGNQIMEPAAKKMRGGPADTTDEPGSVRPIDKNGDKDGDAARSSRPTDARRDVRAGRTSGLRHGDLAADESPAANDLDLRRAPQARNLVRASIADDDGGRNGRRNECGTAGRTLRRAPPGRDVPTAATDGDAAGPKHAAEHNAAVPAESPPDDERTRAAADDERATPAAHDADEASAADVHGPSGAHDASPARPATADDDATATVHATATTTATTATMGSTRTLLTYGVYRCVNIVSMVSLNNVSF
ncbi:hypothetical protein L596_015536 [Steinernema carpocapsae]|uniref:Protein kinase domain-containing protein n=1 Tax=Steinernema carpocapsae TaxID=34508 RepID=A0A4V6A338_STECR|nr:hypothetical protein L596_015536 [Steinernema carpocapsae]